MYVPEELKLNRFIYVHIPSNEEYFQRLGNIDPGKQFTGEEVAETLRKDKVSQIARIEREEATTLAREANEQRAKKQAEEERMREYEELKKAKESQTPQSDAS